jgi:hypothetical protein
VVGGRSGTTYLDLVQAYDPVSDTWGTMKRLPTARAGLGVGVITAEGRLYAVGGRNASTVLATTQRYTP